MRVIVGAVALLLAAAVPLAPPALAADGGTISGQVVDRTAGGDPVGELGVALQALSHQTGAAAGSPVTVRTGADGRFSFGGVDTAATAIYVVTADFRGVTYVSDPVAFAAGETAKTVDLDVYEATERTDALRVLQQHVIVTPGTATGTLQVVEIAIVENSGDTTVVAAPGPSGLGTMRMDVPADARDLDVGGALAQSASMVPGAVVYGGPIVPGQTQLVVSYAVDRAAATYTLRKDVTTPTASVDVLVADAALSARAVGLAGPVSVDASGVGYARFSARDLAVGSAYAVEIGPTGALGSPGEGIPLALVGLLALAGATAYVLLAPRLRRRATTRPRAARPPEPEELDEPLLEPAGRP